MKAVCFLKKKKYKRGTDREDKEQKMRIESAITKRTLVDIRF